MGSKYSRQSDEQKMEVQNIFDNNGDFSSVTSDTFHSSEVKDIKDKGNFISCFSWIDVYNLIKESVSIFREKVFNGYPKCKQRNFEIHFLLPEYSPEKYYKDQEIIGHLACWTIDEILCTAEKPVDIPFQNVLNENEKHFYFPHIDAVSVESLSYLFKDCNYIKTYGIKLLKKLLNNIMLQEGCFSVQPSIFIKLNFLDQILQINKSIKCYSLEELLSMLNDKIRNPSLLQLYMLVTIKFGYLMYNSDLYRALSDGKSSNVVESFCYKLKSIDKEIFRGSTTEDEMINDDDEIIHGFIIDVRESCNLEIKCDNETNIYNNQLKVSKENLKTMKRKKAQIKLSDVQKALLRIHVVTDDTSESASVSETDSTVRLSDALSKPSTDDEKSSKGLEHFSNNISSEHTSITVYPASRNANHDAVKRNSDRTIETILLRFSSNTPPTRKETMSYQLLRLCTMHDLPNPGSISFIRLAQAGFYYAGNNDEVVCFACGMKKAGWQKDDNPTQVHRQSSPNCPFFEDSALNVPVVYIEDQLSQLFLSPNSSSASAINTTDGFNRGGGDESDIGTLLESSGGTSMTRSDVNVSERDSGIATNNSIICQERLQAITKYPQYSTFEKRLGSYKDWPSNMRQNPRDLSQCGFFHSGNQDGVRCFRCGIGLRNWDPDDNPWVEHARWAPQCSYILEVKGQAFVNMIADAARQAETEQDPPNNPQTSPSSAIAAASTSAPCTTDAMGTDSLNHVLDENRQNHTEAKVQNDPGVTENINGSSRTDKAENNRKEVVTTQNIEVKVKLNITAENKTEIAANSKPGPGAEGGCDDIPNKAQCGIAASSRVSENIDEADPETLKKQIKEMSNLTICKICLDEKVSIVFLPCGHLVACAQCSPALRKCPICRQFIKGTVRTQIGN